MAAPTTVQIQTAAGSALREDGSRYYYGGGSDPNTGTAEHKFVGMVGGDYLYTGPVGDYLISGKWDGSPESLSGNILKSQFSNSEIEAEARKNPTPGVAGTLSDPSLTSRTLGLNGGNTTMPPLGQTAPTPTPIGNPVNPPASGTPPALSLPPANAGATANAFNSGIAQQTQSTKDALQAEADKRVAEYDAKIKALEERDAELQELQDAGLADFKDTVFRESGEKRAELDLERQRFDENYNASQALIGELDALLTQGNQAIAEMENTTGLASIMNPRIAKTAQEVQARAGVIQAVLSARSNQMSQAQNQLAAATNAISSIYSDEIDYYKTVLNYYASLKDENNNKLFNLTKEQREHADMRIKILENDLNNLNATRAHIESAMLDPDTALMYAKAGVTLNDSVESINRKIAQYAYSQEVANISNKMALEGYTTTPQPGAVPVQIVDSQGNVRTYYPTASASGGSAGFTLSPGQTRYDISGNPVATAPENTAASEGSKLLSPAEVKSLNEQGYTKVTYGMTRDQAAATMQAQPGNYPTTQLQRGDTGEQVGKLQDWLVANGYMTQADVGTGRGTYGPKTEAAVQKLQDALGVDYSGGGYGRYGPATIAAMQGKPAPSAASSSSSSASSGFSFNPSASDKSKVLQFAATNTSIDQSKLKTDSTYFYWVLSQANAAASGRSL